MRASTRGLVVGAFLCGASALVAAAVGVVPSRSVERARPGDGDLDAPVPPVGAPGGPSRVLSDVELEQWKRGRALFDHPFHRSEGCGTPEMNADSCRACHQDPVIGGAGPLELNVSRYANDNGGAGPFTDVPGGQGLSKLRPPFAEGREEHDPFTADVFEQRQTPALFGAGLIDGISEAEILLHADPNDVNGDGIRGVARMIDVGGGTMEIGRFGWKGQVPRLMDFLRDAMGGECGITTPDDGRGFALVADADAVPDPELSQAQLDDMAFFLGNLAAPQANQSGDPRRADGETLFGTIGCADCHRPALQGANGPVRLFSDLLLHDVSAPGFRGMSEPGAGVGMYRTPPLWGVGATAPYMHDGRAETLEAAILQHFGEADAARLDYIALSQGDKDALLVFLADI